jgi:hypothetical protein
VRVARDGGGGFVAAGVEVAQRDEGAGHCEERSGFDGGFVGRVRRREEVGGKKKPQPRLGFLVIAELECFPSWFTEPGSRR